MENPIARFAPQIFGEYPKQFSDLYRKISFCDNQDKDEIKSLLWKAYVFGKEHHAGQKRLS